MCEETLITYNPMTKDSEEQVTIVQLHGSTESASQFSRTPWGSINEAFIPINACTENSKPRCKISILTFEEDEFMKKETNLPSKLTPLGESKPLEQHENVKKHIKNKKSAIFRFTLISMEAYDFNSSNDSNFETNLYIVEWSCIGVFIKFTQSSDRPKKKQAEFFCVVFL